MTRRLARGAVIHRAADLADSIGLDEVTVTKLARAIKITPPGIYRHIADLAELRAAISQLAASELAAELSSACAGLAGVDALNGLAKAFRAWATKHPGRHTALQTAPDHDNKDGQAAANELFEVMAAALRAYELAGDDLTDAIRFLRSTLHGYAVLEASSGFKQPRSPDTTFNRIVDALDTVLRTWS